jgi:molybdenum cofactor sulfurtransferase
MVLETTSELDRARLDEAFVRFRARYPAYDSTSQLDRLRATEYRRLDAAGHLYLDYTGGGLYADSQLCQHLALLAENVYGNPHSANPTSRAATDLVERARDYVLEFFNASPDEYLVIFTQNASGALKLVGESYPFGPDSTYLMTFDNHNSVNGIREFAAAKGAKVSYVPVVPPDMRTDATRLFAALDLLQPPAKGLFAYPAQSNFSGVQHPLDWIAEARRRGWDVLLDAAAFVPTNRLDLSRWHPDFVDLSFYKIFGYPTGIGCLIARKAALEKLRRPWYAGGTVFFTSVETSNPRGGGYYLSPGPAAFEDGTLNYLGIPAVEIGLRHIAAIGIDVIHERVTALTGWLVENLNSLHHANGSPLVRIHGPLALDRRGATISMNFRDARDRLVNSRLIERRANQIKLSVRTGCYCNPGVGEVALGFSEAEMRQYFDDRSRMSFDEYLEFIDEKKSGAVRVSLGIASNFEDAYRFFNFAEGFVEPE